MENTAASELLDKALLKVESESIKKWVQDQREIWVKLAQLYVNKKIYSGNNTAVDALHLDIVSTAIGL